MKYIVTRQNKDGTFDSVGMSNRTLISGYKTYKNAFKYGINVFGRGRPVRVEVYGDNIFGSPLETFVTLTFPTSARN